EEAAAEVLARRPEVTGFVCLNDRVAMGAVRSALRLGRRVPEDLSIIGFDGEPEAEFAAVPITSLLQPVEEMAEVAVGLLIEGLRAPREETTAREPQHIRHEPRLNERAACPTP